MANLVATSIMATPPTDTFKAEVTSADQSESPSMNSGTADRIERESSATGVHPVVPISHLVNQTLVSGTI
jgi:hypothetical protein